MTAPVSQSMTAVVPQERYVQSYPGCHYMLPSDDEEERRLKLQHERIKTLFGGVIIPPVTLTPGARVLDFGTGSGIWPLDVHLSHPTLSLDIHGIDIEAKIFPRNPPSNVHFSVLSVTKLPSEWTNTVTLVQQRFLNLGLTAADWPAALSEMYRVLKPGGYIQLIECKVLGPSVGPKTNVVHGLMMDTFVRKRQLLWNFYDIVPGLIKHAGFVGLQTKVQAMPLGRWAGNDGIEGSYNFMSNVRNIKHAIVGAGGMDPNDYDRLCDEVEKEWHETYGSHFDYILYTAQKPILIR